MNATRGPRVYVRPMKQLIVKFVASVAVLTLGSSVALAAAGWGDDYEKAAAQAKAEKKLLLLDFTGSDWCGWCIKLDKEVFSKKEFKDYAKENLVLLEVDFPQSKNQTKKLKEQNAKLQTEYKIKGYPTIIVLNSEGKQVGELGYQEGGPKAFIAELDKLKGK
jgi:protein disulfide-isomerase